MPDHSHGIYFQIFEMSRGVEPLIIVISIFKMARIHEFHIKELAKKNVSTSSKLSLSAQFYHSPEIYELERRAIFSRQWILISHSARYKNTGDFVQYEMAGFNFVVLKNKTGEIVAFHNVCR